MIKQPTMEPPVYIAPSSNSVFTGYKILIPGLGVFRYSMHPIKRYRVEGIERGTAFSGWIPDWRSEVRDRILNAHYST